MQGERVKARMRCNLIGVLRKNVNERTGTNHFKKVEKCGQRKKDVKEKVKNKMSMKSGCS